MTPERAAEIVSKSRESAGHGPWSDQINEHMTPDERIELVKKWKTMPGSTTFADVLLSIASDALADETITCHLCGIVEDEHDAIESGWIPSYWIRDIKVVMNPVCAECVKTRIVEIAGEHVLISVDSLK